LEESVEAAMAGLLDDDDDLHPVEFLLDID
jgi:hypothetical protein